MKKNISSRIMSAVLGAALLVSSGVPVYASGTGNSDVTLQVETGEEPSIVSVKVPTEIPLKMDKEGVVTVPQDLKITNLSDSTDVELTGLSVTGKDSWVVKDYSEDLSSKSEGTKELSMSFRGDGTTSTGDVSLTEDSWVVNRSSELPLNVSAKLPKQGSEYKEKGSIAQVNYTFSVKDEPTDPVEQFTVNYVAGENGSVNESSRSFSKGSSLTFPTTTPSEGYVFDKWVDSSTELEVTGSTTVNANMTVKALFKLDDSGEPIESTISNDWSKDRVIKDSTTPVTFSYDSTSPDTRIVSVESDNTAITVEKAVDTYSLGNPGSEIWNVKAVGKGSATVTATLNTGETTQFVVKVYELNVDGDGDITIEVPDLPDKGPGDNINTGDIVIDIPITTPDGDDTITVTPEIPEGTPPLEEGENNINVSVTIDNITINITIVINIEGSGSDNPSDGLHQTIEEAQAMGFTFSSYEDGLQIDSFENKQFKKEINVPEQIGDFKVLKIGDNVFKGQSNLTKITLPNTIKVIGNSAFSGCTGLVSLNIPDIVNAIGGYAFKAVKLDQLSIPSEDILKNTFGVLNGFTGKVYVKTNFVDTPYLLSSNTCGSIRDVVLKGGTVILKSDSSELEVKKEYIGTDRGGESYLFQDKNFNFSYSLFDKIPENVGKFYVPYYANGTRIDRYLQLGTIFLDSIPHNKGSYPILSKDLPYTFRLAYNFKGDGDYVTEIYCDFDFADQDSRQNIGRDIYNAVIHFDDKSMYNGVEIDDSWKIVDFYDIVLKYTWNRSPSGDIKYITHKFTGVNDGYDIHNLYVGGSDGHGIVFSDLIRNTTGSTTAKLKGSKDKPGQYSGLLYCDFENKIISSTTWNSYGGSELIGNGWQ